MRAGRSRCTAIRGTDTAGEKKTSGRFCRGSASGLGKMRGIQWAEGQESAMYMSCETYFFRVQGMQEGIKQRLGEKDEPDYCPATVMSGSPS